MYWMMMGANENKLIIIKAQNMGHTRDKNGTVEKTGPHTYRVECHFPAEGALPVNFTVTHKRELGHLALARILLKVLEGELANDKNNAHAEAHEIKPEPKVLGDRPLLSAPKDSP